MLRYVDIITYSKKLTRSILISWQSMIIYLLVKAKYQLTTMPPKVYNYTTVFPSGKAQ